MGWIFTQRYKLQKKSLALSRDIQFSWWGFKFGAVSLLLPGLNYLMLDPWSQAAHAGGSPTKSPSLWPTCHSCFTFVGSEMDISADAASSGDSDPFSLSFFLLGCLLNSRANFDIVQLCCNCFLYLLRSQAERISPPQKVP